jgi:hypothetical protein
LHLSASSLTPAASEAASIAGVQTSFAQSAEVTLQKLCGLRLSESTVERVAEDAGARLRTLLEDKTTFGPETPWAWQRDARGRTCAYVGLDATGVRQQGQRGAKAEGRMAYVGLLYNPRSEYDDKRPEPHQVRYLAGFYELDELGLQLRRQAAQVGWDEAEQQIALSDGARDWRNSFARTSRGPSAFSISGTPRNISWSWRKLGSLTTLRRRASGLASNVIDSSTKAAAPC